MILPLIQKRFYTRFLQMTEGAVQQQLPTGSLAATQQIAHARKEPLPKRPQGCLQRADEEGTSKGLHGKQQEQNDNLTSAQCMQDTHELPRSSAVTAVISGGGVNTLASQTGPVVA